MRKAKVETSARIKCQWFALCDRDADGTLPHPVLGDVPVCTRCATHVGYKAEEIQPFTEK